MAKAHVIKLRPNQEPDVKSVLDLFPDLLKEKQPIIIVLNQTPPAVQRRVLTRPNLKHFSSKINTTWETVSKVLAVLFVLYVIHGLAN